MGRVSRVLEEGIQNRLANVRDPSPTTGAVRSSGFGSDLGEWGKLGRWVAGLDKADSKDVFVSM